MKKIESIYWFRRDLRLTDNPGLAKASSLGNVLPIYIFDDITPNKFKNGDDSKAYLNASLINLNNSLKNNLNLYIGDPLLIVCDLIKKYNIRNIFWSRCYEPWFVENDRKIEIELKKLKVNYELFNSSYLFDHAKILKNDNSYYKIFGAYKKKVISISLRKPLKKIENINFEKDITNQFSIDDLILKKDISIKKQNSIINSGEEFAQEKLYKFITEKLSGYKILRDYPDSDNTSKLSTNLHFGEISPNQVFELITTIGPINSKEEDVDHFINEIIWREFSCYLMVHFKNIHTDNFQKKFDFFPWENNEVFFEAWKNGKTGYPIIDAGIKELLETGYMHNRVRMIVASFLVKNLMIHWRKGSDYFFEKLTDADIANNYVNWQWVAGSGTDAAPFFRIFNPIIQGEKFDKDGKYTRKFLPELKNISNKYLFKPWLASKEILEKAGITLGVNYPKPIINLEESRQKALFAYSSLRDQIINKT